MEFFILLFLCCGIAVFVLWLFLETDLFKKSKSKDLKQNNKNNGVLENNNESENENKNLLNKQQTSGEKQIINKKLIIFVVVLFIILVGGLFRYEDYKSNISTCDYFYYIAIDRANNVDDEIDSIILQTEALNNYLNCIDNA
tara:strand:- start:411 stop:836 length:426 start_codon:yes stop_codon:yes gene_type:complete